MRPWRKLRGPHCPRLVGSTADYAEEHHAMLAEIERLVGEFPGSCPARRVALLQEMTGVYAAMRRLSESYQRQARMRRVGA